MTKHQESLMGKSVSLVLRERVRQIEKWGDQSGNTLPEWMSILGEEYGELCEAVNETWFRTEHVKPERGGRDAIIREAVQVAAVAMAITEAMIAGSEGHERP